MDMREAVEHQLENRRINTLIHYDLADLYKAGVVENDYDSLVKLYDRLTNLAKDLQEHCLISPYHSTKLNGELKKDENCINYYYTEELTIHDQLYEVYMTIDHVQGMLYRAIRFNN